MLTIFIPTHNRPTLFNRTIKYLNERAIGAKVVVADSSDSDFFVKNSITVQHHSNNLHLIHYDYRGFDGFTKMIKGLEKVVTPFVMICGDDDYLIYEQALHCADFLSANGDYSHAHGLIYTFKQDHHGNMVNIVEYPQINNDMDIYNRVILHYNNYCNNFYAVHKTKTFLSCFLEAYNLNIGDTLKEHALAALCVFKGKRKMFNNVFLLRQKGDTGWDEKGERTLDNNPLHDNYIDTIGYGYETYKEFLLNKIGSQHPMSRADLILVADLIDKDHYNWLKRVTNYVNYERRIRQQNLTTVSKEPVLNNTQTFSVLKSIVAPQQPELTYAHICTQSVLTSGDPNKKIMVESDLSYDLIDRYYNRKSITESLDRHITSFHGVLLDVGCGQMPYREYILNKNPEVKKYIGLDFAKGIYADLKQPDVTWDGQSIPLDDSSVDCAMATEVFEHLPNLTQTLTEIYRVLMPGGLLFFTVPFLWPLHDMPNDEYRYTPTSLMRHLKRAGFVNIDIAASGGWDASLAQMIGLWLKRRPMDEATRQGFIDLLFPFYQDLLRQEAETPTLTYSDMCNRNIMITGLYGTACKKRVSKNTYNKAECLET